MKQRLLERSRNLFFWTLDSMKGSVVRKHYSEINNFFSITDPVQRQEKVDEKLSRILQHAVQTVPYYNTYGGKSITDFPVVDKTLIRENLEFFLSGKFSEEQRSPVVTSGSTGTPFKTFQDGNKKKRNSADTIYFAEKSGFKIGSRLVYLKIWSDYNKKGRLEQWMQNIVPVDVIDLNDAKIKDLITKLESDGSTFGLLGYSSALELLARYLEKNSHGKVKARVGSILSMSEALNEYTKYTLPRYFDVPVLSRYSNIENGIIAQQEKDSGLKFFINSASYYVEVLGLNDNNPVKHGEAGRIVVTDLYNHAMPMLRYDTGDIGIIDPENPGYFAAIEGRKLDQIFDTRGERVSSYIVYKNMWQYTEINQYQLIQHGEKEYTFKINSDAPFQRDRQLIAEFKQYLGNDADFKVEFVDEIPLLASGKRKKIVNTFHNK